MKYMYEIFSVIFILISVALFGGSNWYNEQQQEKYDVSKQELWQIKEKLKLGKKLAYWLSGYKPFYEQLIKEHIVNDEDRLGWIESIDRIVKNEKIPYVKFTLNRQQATKFPFYKKDIDGVSLFKTVMELNFSLLHEGDLFKLLNSLEQQTQGLFLIKSCQLSNKVLVSSNLYEPIDYTQPIEKIRNEIYRHNIDGKCFLDWYTIHKKTQQIN
jgi:hypothetical protein